MEDLTQYNEQMTQKDIAAYYEQLTRGEKGRFTAFISLRLGGSPHSWQHRLLCVARNTAIRPLLEKPRDFDPFGQAGFAHLWLQYD